MPTVNQKPFYKPLFTVLVVLLCLIALGVSWLFLRPGGLPDSGEIVLVPEGNSSFDLIKGALKDGTLDEETSLLYRAYALYGDERLPSQYASGVATFEDNTLGDIRSRWNSLSPEGQKELAPFLKRPDDPESYVNQRFLKQQEEQDSQQGLLGSGFIREAHAAQRPHWNYPQLYPTDRTMVAANGKVKVWYPNSTNMAEADAYKQMAQDIVNALDQDTIIQRFFGLMNRMPLPDGGFGGDDKLDIYIMMGFGATGEAVPDGATFPSSAYVLINSNLMNQPNILKTVVAHEVFHTFQMAFQHHKGKDHWWAEASAVWAEHFAYKSYDTEHKRLKLFFPYPKTYLDAEVDPTYHEYGAYVFAFYLTQNLGDSIIRKIYENCGANSSCLKAIDTIIPGGLKKHWREFTLWNYNKGPAKKYTDPGGAFPPKSSIDSTHNKTVDIEKDEKDIEVDELENLSAQLITATNTVNTNEVKKIVFEELAQFTSKLDGASIKAIIYFKDKAPAVEDWTDKDQRTFCIKCDTNDPTQCKEENFEKVVLVFANGHREDLLPASKVKVVGKEAACSGKWAGVFKVTHTMDVSGPFVGGWVQKWVMTMKEELEEVEVGEVGHINPLAALNDTTIETEYHVMKQEIDFDYLEDHRAGPVTGKGKVTRSHPHPESRGSLINDDTELDTIVRFIKKKEFTGIQSALGHGEYYLRENGQIYGSECDFVVYSHDGVSCLPHSYGPPYFLDGDLEGLEVVPTNDGTRFKGSHISVDPMMNRVRIKVEWDYQRVFN